MLADMMTRFISPLVVMELFNAALHVRQRLCLVL